MQLGYMRSRLKTWHRLRVCLMVFVVFILPGVTQQASGVTLGGGGGPSSPGICPCVVCVGLGENDTYELIKHSPPSNYSMISRCDGRDGMAWAEIPRTNGAELISSEHVNYFRVRLGYHQGTLVVVETQIPLRASENPRTGRRLFRELETVSGVAINHLDVVYSSGHWGFPEPHYDIRMYLVDHAAHQDFECQPKEERGWFQFIKFE